MARRRSTPVDRTGDVRAALLDALREKITAASRTRHPSSDGRGCFASEADECQRMIRILDRGDACDVATWRLPEPWRSEWQPATHVVIGTDGTVTAGVTRE